MPGAFLGTHPHSQVLPALLEVEAELVSLAQCVGLSPALKAAARQGAALCNEGQLGFLIKKLVQMHTSAIPYQGPKLLRKIYILGFFSDHKSFKAPFVSCLGALQTGWLPTRNSAVFLPQTLLHKGMNCAEKNDGFSLSGVSLPLQ